MSPDDSKTSRSTSRGAWLAVVALFAAGAVFALVWGWTSGSLKGRLKSWLQNRVIADQIRKLQPSLPFRVAKFEIGGDLDDLARGRLEGVAIRLERDGWSLDLKGTVTLAQVSGRARGAPSNGYEIRYSPLASVGVPRLGASPPFQVALWAQIDGERPFDLDRIERRLREFGVSAAPTAPAGLWNWKALGWESKDPSLSIHWSEGRLSLDAAISSLGWSRDEEHTVSGPKGVRLSARGELALSPFQLGSQVSLTASAGDTEVLWGETYLDLPLSLAPLSIGARLRPELVPPFVAEVGWAMGPDRRPGLKGTLSPSKGAAWNVTWKMRELPLPDLLARVAPQVPALATALTRFKITRGTLETEGSAQLDLGAPIDPTSIAAKGRVVVRDVSIRQGATWLASGISLSLPWDSLRGSKAATLAVGNFRLRGLRGKLRPTEFSLLRDETRPDVYRLSLAQPLPLEVDDIPLAIGPIAGSLWKGGHRIATSLRAGPFPFSTIAKKLCLKLELMPSAELEASFENLEITEELIDPTGTLRVKAFGGEIVADDLAIFDPLSEVPELQFSAEIRSLQLEQLGKWLHFGKMNGVLAGYARDVVFQQWLPTHFDLELGGKPLPGELDMVFSAEAYCNFLQLISGTPVEEIFPGPLRWLICKAANLKGGYDIRHSGVRLTNQDGWITILSTEAAEIRRRERMGFFVYGEQVRMPYKGKGSPIIKINGDVEIVPIVVDAVSLSRFFATWGKYLVDQAKKGAKEEAGSQGREGPPDETADDSDECTLPVD